MRKQRMLPGVVKAVKRPWEKVLSIKKRRFSTKNHARITCRGKMPLWPLMKQEYGGKQTV